MKISIRPIRIAAILAAGAASLALTGCITSAPPTATAGRTYTVGVKAPSSDWKLNEAWYYYSTPGSMAGDWSLQADVHPTGVADKGEPTYNVNIPIGSKACNTPKDSPDMWRYVLYTIHWENTKTGEKLTEGSAKSNASGVSNNIPWIAWNVAPAIVGGVNC